MEFENNQDMKGIEHIGTLYDAIIYKKVLKITYLQSFKDKVKLEIHPYYLKQYNNRWFLFGYNPDRNKYDWNLPLDRIIEIAEIQKTYIPNTVID
jgi:predicted DNA-binding transcriptional regulator YafY